MSFNSYYLISVTESLSVFFCTFGSFIFCTILFNLWDFSLAMLFFAVSMTHILLDWHTLSLLALPYLTSLLYSLFSPLLSSSLLSSPLFFSPLIIPSVHLSVPSFFRPSVRVPVCVDESVLCSQCVAAEPWAKSSCRHRRYRTDIAYVTFHTYKGDICTFLNFFFFSLFLSFS